MPREKKNWEQKKITNKLVHLTMRDDASPLEVFIFWMFCTNNTKKDNENGKTGKTIERKRKRMKKRKKNNFNTPSYIFRCEFWHGFGVYKNEKEVFFC